MKKIEIESLSELPKVAEAVLGELRGRSVVLFRGPMGAGKTTLISRMAAALGAEDTVTSPTFALPFRFLPYKQRRGGSRSGIRGVLLFGRALSGRVAREDRAAASGGCHDGHDHGWRGRAPYLHDRLIGRSGHDRYGYRRRILRLLKLSSCGGVWSCYMLSARLVRTRTKESLWASCGYFVPSWAVYPCVAVADMWGQLFRRFADTSFL